MREYHGTNEFVTGNDGREKRVFSAYATPSEIRLHLESGWPVHAAEGVRPETLKGTSPPVPRNGPSGSKQVNWLIERHSPEVLVVFIPNELKSREDELFGKATNGRTQSKTTKTRLYRTSARYARDRVVHLIKCSTALVHNLMGKPLDTHHDTRDPIVIQQLTEAREALPELQEVMLPIAENLLNGNGQRLAELNGLPPLDDQSAHCLFQYSLEAMWCVHHLKILLNLVVTAEELVAEFLGALFMNIGSVAKGDVTAQNHAAYSACIYQLICEQKPGLPDTVDDLILDHGNIWLSNGIVRITTDDGTGSVTSERRMYAPAISPMVHPAMSSSRSDGPTGNMELLDSRYIAFALTLTVVEQVVDRSMQGERAADVLLDLATRLTTGGYDLTGDGAKCQSIFASVLAAMANVHKVKPKGAVVAFGKQGKVPGGRPIAVSLGHPDTPSAPWCLVMAHEESKQLLPAPQTMRAHLDHTQGTLRRSEQLLLMLGREPESSIWHTAGNAVIGFVSAPAYRTHCSKAEAVLGHILV